jgi:hypothetical protein
LDPVANLVENTQELMVFFFVYGAIQELQNQYVISCDTRCHLTTGAGSGLLLSVSIVEFSWLLWDLIYIYKRLYAAHFFDRHQGNYRGLTLMRRAKRVWHDFRNGTSVDQLVLKWLGLNTVFGLLFLILWRCFLFSTLPKIWIRATSYPSARLSFLLLLLPMIIYFIAFSTLLHRYYQEHNFITGGKNWNIPLGEFGRDEITSNH